MWRRLPGNSGKDDSGYPSNADPPCRQPRGLQKGDRRSCGIVKSLTMDPMSGYLFVFRNRGSTSLKIICYDGQGFWFCQKRLSKGRFGFCPKEKEALTPMAAHELQALLWNNDPEKMDAPMWKKILMSVALRLRFIGRVHSKQVAGKLCNRWPTIFITVGRGY
jgi:transposase